ncbi:MAG: thioredoxin family protein [Flavobacteriales bacterium]
MSSPLSAYFERGLDYAGYRALVHQVVAEHRTTGPIRTEELAKYTALNKVRMDRNERVVKLLPELREALQAAPAMDWLVLTEAWCGDASQSTPVMALMAEAAPHIRLRFVLRDEQPELMDRYLTNGTRSIPILIAFTGDNERFTWGPRPAEPQRIMLGNKALPEGQRLEKEQLYAKVHGWYAADRGMAIQREFLALLGR